MSSGLTVSRVVIKPDVVVRTLKLKQNRDVLARLNRVGDRAVRLCDEYVSKNFQRRSNPKRRRQPGSKHLAGSFTYTVVGRSFPYTVTIKSSSPIANILEGGARPHQIRKKGKSKLIFPKAPTIGGVAQPGSPNPYGAVHAIPTNLAARAKRVRHPGVAKHQFMEKALRRAVLEVSRGVRR